GWHATSAGLEPQAELGANALRLLAGTPAERFLDREAPRPIRAVPAPDRVIALCCEVPGSTRWDLAHPEFTDATPDEIRARSQALALECQHTSAALRSAGSVPHGG